MNLGVFFMASYKNQDHLAYQTSRKAFCSGLSKMLSLKFDKLNGLDFYNWP